MLAHRTTLFATSGTSKARAAAKAAEAKGTEIVDLSAGEIWSPSPPAVRAGAIAAIEGGVNRYTETVGLNALRDAIADIVTPQNGLSWTADEIAVTAGAKQALFNAAMVILDPGDEVIIPQPYWTTFPAQVAIAGAAPVFVAASTANHIPRIEDISAAVTPATRAIIINTPNNPTGAVYDGEWLRGVAGLAEDHDFWLVFDECYREFVHEPASHTHLLDAAPEARRRTLIVNSFSKSLALTGWRIGYLAAPPAVIAATKALQSHTASNPNVIAQHAVLAYLTAGDNGFIQEQEARLRHNRALGQAILDDLRDVPLPAAQGGFYFYLDLRGILERKPGGGAVADADDIAGHLLADAGVATVSGSAFGDPAGLRLSYGVPADMLERGLTRLVRSLNRLE